MRCEGARVMSDNGCYLAATAEEAAVSLLEWVAIYRPDDEGMNRQSRLAHHLTGADLQ